MKIREYQLNDLDEVIELEGRCGLIRLPNDPVLAIHSNWNTLMG